jgi:hypothetical protein
VALSKVEVFNESLNAYDWKEYIDDKKEGVLIETRVNSSGLNCVRGTGVLEYDLEDVVAVVGNNTKYRKVYDKNYDVG